MKRRSIIRPAREKIRASSLLRCIPVSYAFGVFGGYDHGATYASPWFMFGVDILSSRVPASFSNRTTALAESDPVASGEPLLDTSIPIVLDVRGAALSANANQLGIAEKDTMSACVTSAKERHEAHGREIYLF